MNRHRLPQIEGDSAEYIETIVLEGSDIRVIRELPEQPDASPDDEVNDGC